ncbi:hypothetical protein (nucleomorph) [Guillardia theta]|uniref:Uncharacterized protein n=1 Tax=Guillardia theta TaxID=55529 RepID=Q98S10_GUITH|nr:hypothetical protein GTHECHR3124 [Guillardia theta]AAK39768.1 hypothetical protein [Guillardia theta]
MKISCIMLFESDKLVSFLNTNLNKNVNLNLLIYIIIKIILEQNFRTKFTLIHSNSNFSNQLSHFSGNINHHIQALNYRFKNESNEKYGKRLIDMCKFLFEIEKKHYNFILNFSLADLNYLSFNNFIAFVKSFKVIYINFLIDNNSIRNKFLCKLSGGFCLKIKEYKSIDVANMFSDHFQILLKKNLSFFINYKELNIKAKFIDLSIFSYYAFYCNNCKHKYKKHNFFLSCKNCKKVNNNNKIFKNFKLKISDILFNRNIFNIYSICNLKTFSCMVKK